MAFMALGFGVLGFQALGVYVWLVMPGLRNQGLLDFWYSFLRV